MVAMTVALSHIEYIKSTKAFATISMYYHMYQFSGRVHHIINHPKERWIDALDMARIVGALAEDGGMVAEALAVLGFTAMKFANAAVKITFTGVVIQGVTVVINSYRIWQSSNHWRQLEKGEWPSLEGISTQALYGLKRREILAKEPSPHLRDHLISRLKTGIRLKAVAQIAVVVAIVGVSVLCMGAASLTPLGWGLIGASVAIPLMLHGVEWVIRRKQNQAFNRLENKAS